MTDTFFLQQNEYFKEFCGHLGLAVPWDSSYLDFVCTARVFEHNISQNFGVSIDNENREETQNKIQAL